MEIIKMHCLGNDYLVAGQQAYQYSLPAIARLCSRYSSSGLLIVNPGPPGRRRIDLFNDRGGRVEPGTSALRCAGFSQGAGTWELDTGTRIHRVEVQEDVGFWFPPPVFGGEYQIGRDFHGYLVNMFHRYFVTFVHNLGQDLEHIGEALDRYFGGIDVVFLHYGESIQMRIWHKGGELLGSGTAACVAAATLARLGKWKEPMEILMPGGRVLTRIDHHGRYKQLARVVINSVLEVNPD